MPGAQLLDQTSPQVLTRVTVAEVSLRVSELVSLPPEQWTANDLGYYIGEEIERLHGPQLPNPQADATLERFWERHGARGVQIARRAFEEYRGFWMGAPVTVRRFEEAQDEFFSRPLLSEITGK